MRRSTAPTNLSPGSPPAAVKEFCMGTIYRFNSCRPPLLSGYSHPLPVAQGPSLLKIGLLAVAIYALIDLFDSSKEPRRVCSVCERSGHDRRTCPYDGERLNFSRAIPKSSNCQCCGVARYEIQRHHTRGRSSLSDFLDVCGDCHIVCCHDGHFQNLGKKPQTCRLSCRRSVWRG